MKTMTKVTESMTRADFTDAVLNGSIADGQRAIAVIVNEDNVGDHYNGTIKFLGDKENTVILELVPGTLFWGENQIELFSNMNNNFTPHNLFKVSTLETI